MPEISMTWPQYRRGVCGYDGKLVKMAPTQMKILLYLLLRRGLLCSREELVEWVYPDPWNSPDNEWANIWAQIGHIHKRMPGVVVNEHGRGWMIERPR